MGGAICTMGGRGRRVLSLGVTALNLMLAFAGQSLIMHALILKFKLEARIAVVVGSHGGTLDYFLVLIGLVLTIVCMAAAKVTYDSGCLEKATRRNAQLLAFTQSCQVMAVILLLVGVIVCLVHRSLVGDVFHTGLMAAIKLYRINPKVKTGMDVIQMEFGCCGSRDMTDWFKTPWIAMRYINVDHPDVAQYIIDGEFVKDDAPFSCCNIDSPRACVHHDVTSTKAHKQVDIGGTLYDQGCNDALEDYWNDYVITPALHVLTIALVLTLLAILFSRLLQTSLDNALDTGDVTADGEAYCIRSCPCAPIPTNDPSKVMKKKKKKKKVDEAAEEGGQDTTEDDLEAGTAGTRDGGDTVGAGGGGGGRWDSGGGGGGGGAGDGGGGGEGGGGGGKGGEGKEKKGKRSKDQKGKSTKGRGTKKKSGKKSKGKRSPKKNRKKSTKKRKSPKRGKSKGSKRKK